MRLLVKEFPLVFSPTLAKCLGLKQAIFLQQLHYWIVKKQQKNPLTPKSSWVYNTADQWCKQLPFLKKKSFWRLVTDLKEKNLLLVSNQNRFKFDKTNWYSIHYQNLHSLLNLPFPSSLSDTSPSAFMIPPIPETSHETPHKSISSSKSITEASLHKDSLHKEAFLHKDSLHKEAFLHKDSLHTEETLPSKSSLKKEKQQQQQDDFLDFNQESKNVFLSKSQVVFLLKKYNKTLLKKFITKLSLYKYSSGKNYACDFAAILNWVTGAVLKEQQAQKKKDTPFLKNKNREALKSYLQKNSLL